MIVNATASINLPVATHDPVLNHQNGLEDMSEVVDIIDEGP